MDEMAKCPKQALSCATAGWQSQVKSSETCQGRLQVVGLDFAEEMLEDAAAREAARLQSVSRSSAAMQWVTGDALQLPFDDASFAAATMGYGLRNVTDIPGALSELHRVSLQFCTSGLNGSIGCAGGGLQFEQQTIPI